MTSEERPQAIRSVILAALLGLCAAGLGRGSTSEPTPPRVPLSSFATNAGDWQRVSDTALTPDVLAVLGLDEYINRVYSSGDGSWLGLYVAYYGNQRQGESMHSPLNCMPGAGWQPVRSGREAISVASGPTGTATSAIEINRYVVEKDGQRILVYYWYQSQGRVVASEYWGKFYTVVDAIRNGRTDAALVRVLVPIGSADAAAEARAARVGKGFIQSIFPMLEKHLPV